MRVALSTGINYSRKRWISHFDGFSRMLDILNSIAVVQPRFLFKGAAERSFVMCSAGSHTSSWNGPAAATACTALGTAKNILTKNHA